jgi:hypothetical protein
VLGNSGLARAVGGLLAGRGLLGSTDEASLVVLVADWALSPADHLPWLNRDIPHLPVVAGERAITVGPLVEPGVSPCLYCVHLTRSDADPAWPAIAIQLLGRGPREEGALEVAEAAAFVVRAVITRLRGERASGVSWRLAGGDVSEQTWSRHPDCRCAAPAGSDWVTVPGIADPGAPRTVSAAAAPA